MRICDGSRLGANGAAPIAVKLEAELMLQGGTGGGTVHVKIGLEVEAGVCRASVLAFFLGRSPPE